MSDSEIVRMGKEARSRIEDGEFADAEYFFKKITKLDPENWQAWYGRGLCFKRLKMYERAIFCFSKVTTLQPNSPKGWYNLGFCQSKLEQVEEALFNLNKSIKLDPSYAIAKVIKAWIYFTHNNKKTAKKLLEHVRDNYPDFITKFSDKDPSEEPEDFQIAIDLLFDKQ